MLQSKIYCVNIECAELKAYPENECEVREKKISERKPHCQSVESETFE